MRCGDHIDGKIEVIRLRDFTEQSSTVSHKKLTTIKHTPV